MLADPVKIWLPPTVSNSAIRVIQYGLKLKVDKLLACVSGTSGSRASLLWKESDSLASDLNRRTTQSRESAFDGHY